MGVRFRGGVIEDRIIVSFFFFFQAEDGIRDTSVTGVQTCALPISRTRPGTPAAARPSPASRPMPTVLAPSEIGRASCRERVEGPGVGGQVEKKKTKGGREGPGRAGRAETSGGERRRWTHDAA